MERTGVTPPIATYKLGTPFFNFPSLKHPFLSKACGERSTDKEVAVLSSSEWVGQQSVITVLVVGVVTTGDNVYSGTSNDLRHSPGTC